MLRFVFGPPLAGGVLLLFERKAYRDSVRQCKRESFINGRGRLRLLQREKVQAASDGA
jgi:hypothetical protein